MARTVKKIASGRRGRNKAAIKVRTAGKREKSAVALAVVKPEQIRREYRLSQEQVDLIKTTCCKGASDEELRLFLWVAKKHRLDPLTRQLHAVKRHVTKHHQDEKGIWVPGDQMTIQVGIDGYRAMAARYKDYGAVDEPEYEFANTGDKIPTMARVRLWKKGLEHPTVGIAFWDEYAPGDLNADKSFMWKKMPKLMLAKCAEALALRKGYPDLADIYVDEEMHQADQDYTPEGRQIVDQDGFAPSGRPVTFGAERSGSREAAQSVLQAKLAGTMPLNPPGEPINVPAQPVAQPATSTAAPMKSTAPKTKGAVEIDLTDPKSPILRGDIAELLPTLQEKFVMEWQGDWWRVLPGDVDAMREFVAGMGYTFTRSSGSGTAMGPEHPPAGKGGSAPPSSASPAGGNEPTIVTGVIEQISEKMTRGSAPTEKSRGRASVPYLSILLQTADKKKTFFSCFDNDMFPYLQKAKAKAELCQLFVKKSGEYANIVGIQRIGTVEFEDGKIPIIQQRDREVGGKTLF